MTDPAAASSSVPVPASPGDSAASATPASAQTGQKSPLDILEEILGDAAKNGAGGAAATGTTGVATGATEPQPTPEEIEAKIQAQRAADEAALQAKIVELQGIKQTPEYQARVQQDQAVKASSEQQQADQDGFQIIQLGHTKIPDTPVTETPTT